MTQTTLGPGGNILDQNLLKQILETTALSSTDVLKIASFYKFGLNDDWVNGLILIALEIIEGTPSPQTFSPASSTDKQTTSTADTATTATAPWNEALDQLGDALLGTANDPEDVHEPGHPTFTSIRNMYWIPFSASLPDIGLLIDAHHSTEVESIISGDFSIIGLSPKPDSLNTDDWKPAISNIVQK